MDAISLADAKLSELIDRVKAGATVHTLDQSLAAAGPALGVPTLLLT
jgi:hypothetical protein